MLLVPPPEPRRGSRVTFDGAAAEEEGRPLLDGVLVAAKLDLHLLSLNLLLLLPKSPAACPGRGACSAGASTTPRGAPRT